MLPTAPPPRAPTAGLGNRWLVALAVLFGSAGCPGKGSGAGAASAGAAGYLPAQSATTQSAAPPSVAVQASSAARAPSAPAPSAAASGTAIPPARGACEPPAPGPCTTFAAHGATRFVLCDDPSGMLSPRVTDTQGTALFTALIDFEAALKGSVSAELRDVTGDGVDDVVVQTPGFESGPSPGTRSTCRQVLDGAKLGCTPDDQDGALARSRGRSLAARLSRAPDWWRAAAAASGPIPHATACALIAGVRTPRGFAATATSDGEVVEYDQPGMPWCATFPTDAPRGLTAARLDAIEPVTCTDLQCAPDTPLCWNHEANPGADFYLFTKAPGGGYKIRGIAVYTGS